MIAATLKSMNDNLAIQLSFPSSEALTRNLRVNKTTRNKFIDRPLLRHGGKEDNERFIILENMDNLRDLRVRCKVWLCDGFFKILPFQFYQLYTVYFQIGGFYPHAFTFCSAIKKSPLATGSLKP